MGDKFNNKYRIPSARLQSWDYGNSGLYFLPSVPKIANIILVTSGTAK